MPDPKPETVQSTSNVTPNPTLSAANGTTTPATKGANEADDTPTSATVTGATGTDVSSGAQQDTVKQTASKTSASKPNTAKTKTSKQNAKPTAGKQTATKAGTTKQKPQNASEPDSAWIFSQWQAAFDQQLSTLRTNMNNWPGKAVMNMDDSKTAINDAADNLKECSETLTEGMRHINHHMIDNMQTDVNRVLEMTRALLDAKTLEEAVEIQSGFVHETTHAQLQHTREYSEMAIQTTKDSLEPFSETWQNFYANMTKQSGK